MNREKTTATLLILLMAALFAPMVFAAKPSELGPIEKATGYVGWYETFGGGQYRYTDFNAHEGFANRPAKGYVEMTTVRATDGLILRVFKFDVKYVEVEDEFAWFAAECISDTSGSHVGRWLFFKAKDGGTPGRKGDLMGWGWMSEVDAAAKVNGKVAWNMKFVVESGNLVVHT